MLQLKCTQVIEKAGEAIATVLFDLWLNGQRTNQWVSLQLQPDFCEVGDTFSLTATDFDEIQPRNIFSILTDSPDSLN